MAEALLALTSPVFKVADEIRGELARDIVRLEISETTAGLKTLTARLTAQGPDGSRTEQRQLYLDGVILDFGKKLSVVIGAATQAYTVFNGWVSAIEAEFQEARVPEVIFFAEDKLMKLRMTRRMKTYTQMTDADIARAIAAEHGLSPEVDADGPVYDVVQQWNMSDLAFLRERARLIQAELRVEEEKLYFQSRARRTGTELTLVQGNQLLTLRARADLAHQRTSVKVSGYDAARREMIEEEAGADTVRAEVAEGATGPEVLERAFGERVSHRVREAPLKSGEATDWARAEMLRRARGFVTVSGVTRGSADMVVGSRLTLERVGRPFSGSGYYVTRVCHTWDRRSGFRTHFDAERATIQEGA
ncbi:MAG: phage late control D family protein [Blastocatellia bacterium]